MRRSHKLALSRREWLMAAGCFSIATPKLRAEELAGFYYRDYSKCLPDHLASLAQASYEKRNAELAKLTSAEAIRERQRWVRRTFWKLVGGEPERTPLNARVTGHFERTGYRLQKVVYESRPRLFVSANLYLPTTGKPPYPGVLFQMGHSANGKAYPSYQKCCQGLARLGYVVLAFDPMGQGERIAYPKDAGTDSLAGSATDEHDISGKQLLLLGDSASRNQVWDAMRSLDYLAAHESVDKTRLASTGQSGGGTLTMMLACVDDRLAAAAVSSGNTEDLACRNFNPPGSTDDAEQDFVGSGTVGFDRWDLLYPIAPKPLLIEVSSHDFFGTYSPRYLDDGREQYERLSKVYTLLGSPDSLAWSSTPMPHGLTYSLRLEIYNWFERWLKNSDRRIEDEPPVAPEADSALWVGATGNVMRDFSSVRLFDLIKQQATNAPGKSGAADWKQKLPVVHPPGDLKFAQLATVRLKGARLSAVEVKSATEVAVPAWLFTPDKPAAGSSALLLLDDRGRNRHAHEDDLYHQLARSGRVVCAADVRGIGDSRPEVGRGNPEYTIPHAIEEEFAWASLILGDPLLAQRISDILAMVRALRNQSDSKIGTIVLAARGELTVPALFAFSVSNEVDSLYLAGGLASFQNLLRTGIYRHPLANFCWELYRVTDLPVLAEQSAPRKIHLAGTVDASNNPMSLSELRGVYTTSNVRLSLEPTWDEKSLDFV